MSTYYWCSHVSPILLFSYFHCLRQVRDAIEKNVWPTSGIWASVDSFSGASLGQAGSGQSRSADQPWPVWNQFVSGGDDVGVPSLSRDNARSWLTGGVWPGTPAMSGGVNSVFITRCTAVFGKETLRTSLKKERVGREIESEERNESRERTSWTN